MRKEGLEGTRGGRPTCDKLTAFQIVRVADVVVAEASDTVVIERLDISTYVCVKL